MMGKGRGPCCDKAKVKKGPWTPAEDLRLIAFIQKNGHDNWRSLPKLAGLARCGKSCRLRWINYLRPDVKRGNFTPDEEDTIISLHQSMGNKWSRIASYFPGRTDNEIKNIWNTHLKKRVAKPREGDDKDFSDITSSLSSSCHKSGKGKRKMEGHEKPHCEQNKRIITVPLEDTSTNSNLYESNVVVTIPKSCESDVYNKTSSSEEEVDKPLGDGYDCLLPNVEVDLEFWSMLDMDNLGSYFQTSDDIVVQDKVVDDHHHNSSEQNKWLEQLETELGLVGDHNMA